MRIRALRAQAEFITSNAPYPAIVGGLGSGKTEGAVLRILRLIKEDPRANIFYGMPTHDLLELRAIPGMEEALDKHGMEYTFHTSKKTIFVKGHGNIIFRSYDNPKRIVAFEVAHAIVDEIDTLEKTKAGVVWRKISERVRQITPFMEQHRAKNSIGCVTTPDQGFGGLVYNKWVEEKTDNYVLIKASTYDNPFLPDGYIDQITENYDPQMREMYLSGEFVSLTQNKQFWAYDRLKHDTDMTIDSTTPLILIAIDFNVGGTVTTIWQRSGDKLIAVDEIVGQNTQDAIQKIASKYPYAQKIGYPDASGRNESANADLSSIALLEEAGWRIDAPQSNPSVRASINSVNNLLSKDRLFINTSTCPQLADAVERIGYKKGKPEKFDTHPAPDDFTDGLRYICHRVYPSTRPTYTAKITGT